MKCIHIYIYVSHYYNLLAKLTLTINFSITVDGQIEAIVGPMVRSVERRTVLFYFHEIKMCVYVSLKSTLNYVCYLTCKDPIMTLSW